VKFKSSRICSGKRNINLKYSHLKPINQLRISLIISIPHAASSSSLFQDKSSSSNRDNKLETISCQIAMFHLDKSLQVSSNQCYYSQQQHPQLQQRISWEKNGRLEISSWIFRISWNQEERKDHHLKAISQTDKRMKESIISIAARSRYNKAHLEQLHHSVVQWIQSQKDSTFFAVTEWLNRDDVSNEILQILNKSYLWRFHN
jgi:hypothetical protein